MELTKESYLSLMGIQVWRYRLLESAQGPWLFQPVNCEICVAVHPEEWQELDARELFEQWCFALNLRPEVVGVVNAMTGLEQVAVSLVFGGQATGARSLLSLKAYIQNPQLKRELWVKTVDLKRP